MSSSSDPVQGPPGPAQLTGWKDIAAYLGRSVRTVQRWEKDYGLPVRRFGLSRPESVFALSREVDEWLLTSQGASARAGAGAPETAGRPAESSVPDSGTNGERDGVFGRTSMGRMGVAAIVTAVVMAVLWVAWFYRHQRGEAIRDGDASTVAEAPADWHIDLDTLVVSDRLQRTLWTHRFPRGLAADAYRGSGAVPRDTLGGIADVDGDGRRELWFVAKSEGGPAATALYLFEHDGRVRWMYQPSLSVRFGKETFGPSWFVSRLFVTADPGGSTGRALWAVLYDAALFPSLLQRLDPRTGKPMSAFWSNGYIIALALDVADNRHRLFLGTCNNEHKAAGLVVLDALNPNGSAPAELEKYRCTSCPPGEPDVFLVFPKPARFGVSDQTGAVERVSVLADGGVTVGAQHASAGRAGLAVAIYTFDAELNPRAADTADDYLKVYRALVSQGAARAGAPATVDPDREFFPILRWDSAERRFVTVPKAAASR
jgi:hypothetical protein